MQGVASNTRKILTYGKKVDPFVETVGRHFTGFVPRSELVRSRESATPRPVAEFAEWIRGLGYRHTDALLVP